jgi:uncharacterized protein (TIGR02145 family)
MKNYFFILMVIAFAISGLQAQELQIHKTDGTLVTVPLSAIDSITFIDGASAFLCGLSTISDIDGNVYNTVLIGGQCWMKENLKTTKDAQGNNINRHCYDNKIEWCELYGGLYTWYTVMNGSGSSNTNPSGVQGICPTGWHLPSDDEWSQLVAYVIAQGFPNSNVTNGAGNALKSCRQVNSPLGGDCNTSEHPRWNAHSTNYGFDEFSFSSFAAGYLSTDGTYYALSAYGNWWTSTQYSFTNAWYRRMYNENGYVNTLNTTKYGGYSVRCLRD